MKTKLEYIEDLEKVNGTLLQLRSSLTDLNCLWVDKTKYDIVCEQMLMEASDLIDDVVGLLSRKG